MKSDCFLCRNPLELRANEIQVHHDREFNFTAAQAMAETDPGKPVVFVIQNGSRWMGEDYAGINQLIEVLAEHELDPIFEDYGNFIQERSICAKTDLPLWPAGFVDFHGNFFHLSHGFQIVTNDGEVIEQLTAAIAANRASPAYQQARKDRAEQERKRKADHAAYMARK